MNYLILLALGVFAGKAMAAPCENTTSLTSSMDCIRKNEPAFTEALHGEREAERLENSAYRLINPDLQLEYLDGASQGSVQRETTASLLFTFELGGKRSARAKIFNAEGLNLQADAFEQQILALTELGGGLLRLYQLEIEKTVLQEAADTFRKVIRLFKSRGQLPPEQKVSLNTFELVLLDYDQKLLEVGAELLRFQNRTQLLFGSNAKGQPLDTTKFITDIKNASQNLDEWLSQTPEMLRLRAEQSKAEGEYAAARAEMWPNLTIGPAVKQTTGGPFVYQTYGVTASIPFPILTWNSSLRESRRITEKRVVSKVKWEYQDVRSQYLATLSQLEKISSLLKEIPNEKEVHQKHMSTENLYSRGLVGGALMIEAHRSMVEYYETKHALERRFLEDTLKIQTLSKTGKL